MIARSDSHGDIWFGMIMGFLATVILEAVAVIIWLDVLIATSRNSG